MSLTNTTRGNRTHIGFYGKRNSGKSSLINAFAGHEVAIASDVAGTTTDPVYKSMEIYPIGPCVLIDTAGFDDEGDLGKLRVEKTKEAGAKTDLAVLVFHGENIEEELRWFEFFKEKGIPILSVISKGDLLSHDEIEGYKEKLSEKINGEPVVVSIMEQKSIDDFKDALVKTLPKEEKEKKMTDGLVEEGDLVLLVMPQDIQAPKGRLILPQVQVMRELLDKKALIMSSTVDKVEAALAKLSEAPKLIITDSQVFDIVHKVKPEGSLLTSFSILFAGLKGDIQFFADSAKAIEGLTENSKVLIAEACTHAPLSEDIGRVKIPNALRKKVGPGITIDMVSGTDFPKILNEYDLIIQCGSCMVNRQSVMSRVEMAKEDNVPMTNYGIVLAYLTGILDKVCW